MIRPQKLAYNMYRRDVMLRRLLYPACFSLFWLTLFLYCQFNNLHRYFVLFLC